MTRKDSLSIPRKEDPIPGHRPRHQRAKKVLKKKLKNNFKKTEKIKKQKKQKKLEKKQKKKYFELFGFDMTESKPIVNKVNFKSEEDSPLQRSFNRCTYGSAKLTNSDFTELCGGVEGFHHIHFRSIRKFCDSINTREKFRCIQNLFLGCKIYLTRETAIYFRKQTCIKFSFSHSLGKSVGILQFQNLIGGSSIKRALFCLLRQKRFKTIQTIILRYNNAVGRV